MATPTALQARISGPLARLSLPAATTRSRTRGKNGLRKVIGWTRLTPSSRNWLSKERKRAYRTSSSTRDIGVHGIHFYKQQGEGSK